MKQKQISRNTNIKPYRADILAAPQIICQKTENYVLIFIISGSAQYTFESMTQLISRNQVLILSPGCCYQINSLGPECEYFQLSIEKHYFEAFLSSGFPDLHPQAFRTYRSEETSIEKAEYLNYLCHRFTESAHPSLTLGDRILFLCISLFQSQNIQIDNHIYIEKFMQKLEDPQYLGYSIDQLCEEFPYSHSMLLRYFKKYMNMTVVEYRSQQKLKMACKMLREQDQKVIDIATYLHYNSLSHFLRAFKKAYGMTPTQYREKYKLE